MEFPLRAPFTNTPAAHAGAAHAPALPVPAMSTATGRSDAAVLARTLELQAEALRIVRVRTDRLFVPLMVLQWLAGIAASLWLSPRVWSGAQGAWPLNLSTAAFLGGAIAGLPIALVFARPGLALTRHVVAAGQMLSTALLIHLSGGRSETHFLVFVSLAVLALYRDSRVLITASVVVLADHLLRGAFWPESVYGVAHATPWRALEHGAWVAFADAVLIVSIRAKLNDLFVSSERQAQLEQSRGAVEKQVRERTRELQASEQRFRMLSAASPVGIIETDTVGSCVYVNPWLLKLSGLTLEQSLGDGWARSVNPDDRAGLLAERDASMGAEELFEYNYRLVRPDGELLWVHARAVMLHDATGQVTGSVGTIEDITKQKRMVSDLISAREDALETARVKSEFLANVSHEIRTPMNGIIGMTGLALDTELTADQREFIDAVRTSAEALLVVVNDLLDFSRIDAGKMTLEAIPFSLRGALAVACRTLRVQVNEKGLELACEFDDDLPHTVVGDPGRLRQVLLNLLGNAIKFTAQGSVGLKVRGVSGTFAQDALDGQAEQAQRAQIEFEVSDTGIGIPSEKQALIFEAFTQADGSTTRRFGGTGLGLAISSRLVDAMGGSIHVQSEVGRGSTFRFTLPYEVAVERAEEPREDAPMRSERPSSSCLRVIAPATAKAHARAAGIGGRSVRVLLADDQSINRLLVTHILELHGHEVVSVEDGQDALTQLEQQTFDLVLMDIQMPTMGGVEATAAIRGREAGTGRHVPIVALTARAMSGDRERFLAAGMDGYLSKPFKPAQLVALVESLGGPGEKREARPPLGPAA